jgi:hypothetical protein
MASSLATVNKLARNKLTMYNNSANKTGGLKIGLVDMRDYGAFVVGLMNTVLSGAGVSAYSIVANTHADGSGTDREIKAGASTLTAEGDYVWLECTAEEVAQIGTDNSEDLRYVSLKCTCANASDEVAAVYMLCDPKFSYNGLTADDVT